MTELTDLYQEVILDHNKRPRNFHKLEGADRMAEGYNPLCGDKFTIYLDLDGDVLRDLSFEGAGCAISKASASMMTEALRGKSRAEVEAIFAEFHALVTGEATRRAGASDLGKLVVFSGVREFPVRVKCASLAWHTLKAALENRKERASTE
jgi:nitrogen fixation NifU-like protein